MIVVTGNDLRFPLFKITGGKMAQAREAVRSQIAETNRRLKEALSRGDAAAMAGCYTEDALLLPPNSEPIERSGIEAFWGAASEAGVGGIDLETVEVEEMGETAWEFGRFLLKDKQGRDLDNGKYIVVWKQDRGGWRLHRDIWSSSRQPG
jgi:ketosteroid isomerase-like protein